MRRENKISISIYPSPLCWCVFFSNKTPQVFQWSTSAPNYLKHTPQVKTTHLWVKSLNFAWDSKNCHVGRGEINSVFFLYPDFSFLIPNLQINQGKIDMFLKSTRFSEVLCSVSNSCQKETRISNEMKTIMLQSHIVVRGMKERRNGLASCNSMLSAAYPKNGS